MSSRWDDWVHAIVSTRGTWLPGDPRGFRSHDHRIHSSGDYKHPPVKGEHRGLHRYAVRRSAGEVHIPPKCRSAIAAAFAAKLLSLDHPVRICAIGRVRGHALVRVGAGDAKLLIGRAKQAASFAAREQLPGTIWAQGCHVVRIEDERHYRWVVGYIQKHEHEGAFVWVHPRWQA